MRLESITSLSICKLWKLILTNNFPKKTNPISVTHPFISLFMMSQIDALLLRLMIAFGNSIKLFILSSTIIFSSLLETNVTAKKERSHLKKQKIVQMITVNLILRLQQKLDLMLMKSLCKDCRRYAIILPTKSTDKMSNPVVYKKFNE